MTERSLYDTPGVMTRFWPKTSVSAPEECWEWQAALRNGYGVLIVGGVVTYAHRISYEVHHGPIPTGKHILHSCDNPRCVNPAHLSVGTQADNVRDASRKGRMCPGEKHWNAKLTTADVQEIFHLRRQGVTQKDIAGRFGVSKEAVSAVCRGTNWHHVARQEQV